MNPPDKVARANEERLLAEEHLEKLDAYVSQELHILNDRAKTFEEKATRWYRYCSRILVIAVAFALFRAVMSSLNTDKVLWLARATDDWKGIVRTISSSLIVVALLVAMARFSFVMGKSFMVESIRNNNRRHAISFGQFYLHAFRGQVTWADAKDRSSRLPVLSGSSGCPLAWVPVK